MQSISNGNIDSYSNSGLQITCKHESQPNRTISKTLNGRSGSPRKMQHPSSFYVTTPQKTLYPPLLYLRCTQQQLSMMILKLFIVSECFYADGSSKFGCRAGYPFHVYINILQHQDYQNVHDQAGTPQTKMAGKLVAAEFLLNQGHRSFSVAHRVLSRLWPLDKGAGNIANVIRTNVHHAKDRCYDIRFMCIPSHVGIPSHDHSGRRARSSCDEQSEVIQQILEYLLLGFHTS